LGNNHSLLKKLYFSSWQLVLDEKTTFLESEAHGGGSPLPVVQVKPLLPGYASVMLSSMKILTHSWHNRPLVSGRWQRGCHWL